jgi:hypothetical protein
MGQGVLKCPGSFQLCGRCPGCFNWRMSERDDFLAWVGSQLTDAEIALHNGDATRGARFGLARNQ